MVEPPLAGYPAAQTDARPGASRFSTQGDEQPGRGLAPAPWIAGERFPLDREVTDPLRTGVTWCPSAGGDHPLEAHASLEVACPETAVRLASTAASGKEAPCSGQTRS